MLTSQTRAGHDGKESVETRMAVYTRLDNPMLATVVNVLQPFLRGVINGKLAGPFLAVHRMGELIAADPGQVSRQAETISELDKTELDALRVLLLPSLTPARPCRPPRPGSPIPGPQTLPAGRCRLAGCPLPRPVRPACRLGPCHSPARGRAGARPTGRRPRA